MNGFLTSEYRTCNLLATRTEQEAEECGSPTKTPGSESRCMEGSVSDYYTITALDVTPDDSESKLFARGQHVTVAYAVVGCFLQRAAMLALQALY